MRPSDRITVREGYAAMFCFLERVYELTHGDGLGALLGSMSMLPDGHTADPAAWSDWLEPSRRPGQVASILRFGSSRAISADEDGDALGGRCLAEDGPLESVLPAPVVAGARDQARASWPATGTFSRPARCGRGLCTSRDRTAGRRRWADGHDEDGRRAVRVARTEPQRPASMRTRRQGGSVSIRGSRTRGRDRREKVPGAGTDSEATPGSDTEPSRATTSRRRSTRTPATTTCADSARPPRRARMPAAEGRVAPRLPPAGHAFGSSTCRTARPDASASKASLIWSSGMVALCSRSTGIRPAFQSAR